MESVERLGGQTAGETSWSRRSLRRASSARPSSGTTSSCTARRPRWSSATCSSPESMPLVGTLLAFATYAVGFVARPLGGVVFGHYGDRIGRKSMLVLVAADHGCCHVPDRPAAHLRRRSASVAPILLVVLRFVQGIGVGGEWGGAVLMSVEHGPEGPAAASSALAADRACPPGCSSRPACSRSCRDDRRGRLHGLGLAHPVPGQRVLVAVGLFIRLKLMESPAFERVRRPRPRPTSRSSTSSASTRARSSWRWACASPRTSASTSSPSSCSPTARRSWAWPRARCCGA